MYSYKAAYHSVISGTESRLAQYIRDEGGGGGLETRGSFLKGGCDYQCPLELAHVTLGTPLLKSPFYPSGLTDWFPRDGLVLTGTTGTGGS